MKIHRSIILIIINVWLGYGFAVYAKLPPLGMAILTLGSAIVALLLSRKNVGLRILGYLLGVLSVVAVFVIAFPMPSVSVGIEVENQAGVPLNVYVTDVQELTVKKIRILPGERKWAGLCHGEDTESLAKNIYLVCAVDKLGNVRFQKTLTIADVLQSKDHRIVIGSGSNRDSS